MIRPLTIALCLASGLAMADTETQPPHGAIEFCLRNFSYCGKHDPVSAPESATKMLVSINRQVNDEILPYEPKSDAEKLAEVGDWRAVAPGGLGTCVEYMLTKYLRLSWDGIPMGAMRFAQVHAPGSDEDHAVLLVRVKGVEVVLDNLTNVMWPAADTKYEWIAVQDETNGLRWVKPDGVPK